MRLIILLPMVVTIFASQVCSAPVFHLLENRERKSYNMWQDIHEHHVGAMLWSYLGGTAQHLCIIRELHLLIAHKKY